MMKSHTNTYSNITHIAKLTISYYQCMYMKSHYISLETL